MTFPFPIIPPKAAATSSYSFNMTAGDYATVVQGYVATGSDTGAPAIGSIDAEPIPGQTLDNCVSGGAGKLFWFDGDVTSLLSGLVVWVDSTSYASGFSGWSFDGTNTIGSWASGGPTYVDGISYFIEIK